MVELLGYVALAGLMCWAATGFFAGWLAFAAFVEFLRHDDPF